jgi:transposase-like protein
MIQLQSFKTLVDLLTYFNSEQVCRDYLELVRWQGELTCPYKDCGGTKIFKYNDGKRYKCASCQRQFSVKVGTIFEDSKIPLQKWYAAIYLITSHKKGISSLQLHRDIGVTQKTAWYLLHRVRHSFGWNVGKEKLQGTVEADETFIGGKEANKHKSKRTKGTQGRSTETKTPVAGVIERGGELRVKKVVDTTGYQLRKFVYDNVEKGSQLHTDEWWGYKGLEKLFKHAVIRHNDNEYVNADVHTNTLEGFWSLLKRGVIGIYHSISDKHLQKYLDEFSFRYNTRNYSEQHRFNVMLSKVANHLPYKELTKDEKAEIKWFKPIPTNQWLEAKQGSLSFPNENASGNIQE